MNIKEGKLKMKNRIHLTALVLLVLFMLDGVAGEINSPGNDQVSVSYKATEPQVELPNIKPGTKIKLTFRSDNTFQGKYCGLEIIEPATYRLIYAEYCRKKSNNLILPRPGEKIIIKLHSGQSFEAFLNGFDYGRVSVTKLEDTLPHWINLTDLGMIVFGNRNELSGDMLKNLAASGQIPLLSAIAVEDGRFRNLIALHEVKEIEVNPNKN
jgi:hypothetical protein